MNLIVTIYDMDNYGNRLQNYATNKIINELSGHCVKNLNTYPLYHFRVIVKNLLQGRLCSVARNIRFLDFDKKYARYLQLNKATKIFSRHGHAICGSDQIWNPHWMTDNYFAPFVPKERRIAYAASFGVSDIPDEKKTYYKNKLSGIRAISVREKTGATILKELLGIDVPVLIDPTLMLDRQEWKKVAKKPRYYKEEKYVLTYFLGCVEIEKRKYIENICKQKKLKIINLEMVEPNSFWYHTGPAEFIWLIEHCEFMFTDSFHGSVFSIIMQVPFIVFDRRDSIGEMGSRLETLLATMKLPERKFAYQTISEILNVDYSHIPYILEQERDKAKKFLAHAFE